MLCSCDRTGEFAAAYAMQFQNSSYTANMKYDVGVPTPPRPIGYSHQLYAQWYCNFLHYGASAYPHPYDCTNCEEFSCGTPEGRP